MPWWLNYNRNDDVACNVLLFLPASKGKSVLTKAVSVNEFVLELREDGPRLKGGRCRACGNHTFPSVPGCAQCTGTDIEAVTLGSTGTLWGWTVQGFPPKSPPYLGDNNPETFKPFGVGYVELPELIIEARLTEAEPVKLNEGMPMTLVVEPLFTNDEGNTVMTYAFAPI